MLAKACENRQREPVLTTIAERRGPKLFNGVRVRPDPTAGRMMKNGRRSWKVGIGNSSSKANTVAVVKF